MLCVKPHLDVTNQTIFIIAKLPIDFSVNDNDRLKQTTATDKTKSKKKKAKCLKIIAISSFHTFP